VKNTVARLRYYMHDGPAAFSFELAGGLSRDGARELEQAWRTASSVRGGRDLIIDLSYVTSIDEAGRALLSKWHAEGARLVAISAEAKSRVQAMTDRPILVQAAYPRVSTWFPFRAAARR
jgi:ABC-type transporter Mla MlaB component